MKKTLTSLFTFAAGLFAFTSSAATETINFNQKISGLEVNAGIKVVYQPTNGSTSTINITGSTERINNVDIRIEKSTLVISPKRNRSLNKSRDVKGVVVTLSAPATIDEFEVQASATLNVTKPYTVTTTDISIEANAGASVSFVKLACNKCELESNAGATIDIDRLTAQKAELEANAGATIKITHASTQYIECEANAAGKIKIEGGSSKRGSFEANAGGSIQASEFAVNSSSIDKSAGGSVRIKTID